MCVAKLLWGFFMFAKLKNDDNFLKSMVQTPNARVHNHYPIDIDIIN